MILLAEDELYAAQWLIEELRDRGCGVHVATNELAARVQLDAMARGEVDYERSRSSQRVCLSRSGCARPCATVGDGVSLVGHRIVEFLAPEGFNRAGRPDEPGELRITGQRSKHQTSLSSARRSRCAPPRASL